MKFSWTEFAAWIGSTAIISWTIYFVVIAGLAITNSLSKFPMGKAKDMRHLLFIACLTMAGLGLGLFVSGKVMEHCCNAPMANDLGFYLGSMFTGGLITAAITFLMAYRNSHNRVTELERATAEARYETLKTQMQPHFLFNSLNSLSELIDAKMPEAASMTTRLADLYRHILENSKEKTTTLASELTIIRDYLELERLRFGDRLSFTFHSDVDEGKTFVPSLILQTLVENAVKHGISPAVNGGNIAVRAVPYGTSTLIEIINTGTPPRTTETKLLKINAPGTGTGLINVKERLQLIYGPGSEFFFGLDNEGRTLVRFLVTGAKLV